MAETYALISDKLNLEKGEWYLYMKSGCAPIILFHKAGSHGSDLRACYRRAGWTITPMKFYTVDDNDVK